MSTFRWNGSDLGPQLRRNALSKRDQRSLKAASGNAPPRDGHATIQDPRWAGIPRFDHLHCLNHEDNFAGAHDVLLAPYDARGRSLPSRAPKGDNIDSLALLLLQEGEATFVTHSHSVGEPFPIENLRAASTQIVTTFYAAFEPDHKEAAGAVWSFGLAGRAPTGTGPRIFSVLCSYNEKARFAAIWDREAKR